MRLALCELLTRVVLGLSGGPLEKQQTAINEMVENPTLLYRSLIDLTCEKAGKAAFDLARTSLTRTSLTRTSAARTSAMQTSL